jgi:hypothetical protein
VLYFHKIITKIFLQTPLTNQSTVLNGKTNSFGQFIVGLANVEYHQSHRLLQFLIQFKRPSISEKWCLQPNYEIIGYECTKKVCVVSVTRIEIAIGAGGGVVSCLPG